MSKCAKQKAKQEDGLCLISSYVISFGSVVYIIVSIEKFTLSFKLNQVFKNSAFVIWTLCVLKQQNVYVP